MRSLCLRVCAQNPRKEALFLGQRTLATISGNAVKEAIEPIASANGLFHFTPHIEYLIGSTRGTNQYGEATRKGGILDIADKTQFILQSSHPVRYRIEREMKSMSTTSSSLHQLKYLDWVAFFGRSLVSPVLQSQLSSSSSTLAATFEDKLCNISTAAECGMFSSDVHETVVDITEELPGGSLRTELNIGNKYAVLVGDYFAIKAIFFAEKVKSSPVFLKIVGGVEDFTYSSFVSNLLDANTGYPILPSLDATVPDWMAYGIKSSGYFTGGLRAAHTYVTLLEKAQKEIYTGGKIAERRENFKLEEDQNLTLFVTSLALTLKGVCDLREFKVQQQDAHGQSTCSPFLLVSLPAVLYQQDCRDCFANFRNSSYVFHPDEAYEIRQKISKSSAIPQATELVQSFATQAMQAFPMLAQDECYTSVILNLLKTIANDPHSTL